LQSIRSPGELAAAAGRTPFRLRGMKLHQITAEEFAVEAWLVKD